MSIDGFTQEGVRGCQILGVQSRREIEGILCEIGFQFPAHIISGLCIKVEIVERHIEYHLGLLCQKTLPEEIVMVAGRA